MSTPCGTLPRWPDVFTRTLGSGPAAVEKAYAVYARLDELAGSPADDPRVEATAQAIVAAIPESAREAIRFPDGDIEETGDGFIAAFYADFPRPRPPLSAAPST